MKYALTYDDIQLVPDFSNIKSRQKIKLNTMLSERYGLLNPIVASPMDTVCDLKWHTKWQNWVELGAFIDL
jgi:IMP dehydrogenase